MHLSGHVFRFAYYTGLTTVDQADNKLINEIDHLKARLSYYEGLRADVYSNKYRMCDAWKFYKLESLSLMHDISYNKVSNIFSRINQ